MEKSGGGTQLKHSCAYCGRTELTREHLIPKGYFDRTGRAVEFVANIKAGAADKIVSVEPTISDVCRHCNNGVLSKLDTYFLALFDRYFTNVVVSGKQINMEFNFDELLRWLLKMGYNMGRARQWDGVQLLTACKDYIRFGGASPSSVTVLMQAVTPGLSELASGFFIVNAMRVPRIVKNFAFVLHVGIHCYQFYVLFHHPGTNGSERKMRTKAFQRIFRGTYEVCPNRPIMEVYPSSIALWDLLNGPLWNAGWAQHLKHHFGKRRTDGKSR
jgi:hypothetical protein